MPELITERHRSVVPPIQLAFFDIDGTLLDRHGQFSQRLVDEMHRVREAGVKTAIASGRPHFAAQFLFEHLPIIDLGVFCTGAHIYSPESGQTYYTGALPKAVASRLLAQLREEHVYYEMYGKDAFYSETEFASDVRESHAEHLRVNPIFGDLQPVLQSDVEVLKFLLGAPGQEGHETLKALEARFPECQFAYAHFPAFPDWHFASVIHLSACKRRAFDFVLSHYQIDAQQVLSFGDSQSDMVFLEKSGHGVAMGNASPAVKAVARWHTGSSCEDGVAHGLSRLI